jgi:hypothetical protein
MYHGFNHIGLQDKDKVENKAQFGTFLSSAIIASTMGTIIAVVEVLFIHI